MSTKKALTVGVAMVALTVPAIQKAQAATTTLNLDANIITAVSLSEGQRMDFGDVAPAAGASTVTLAPDGSITEGGGANQIGGSQAVGIIVIQASPGVLITISAATDPVTITGPGPAMNVSSFRFDGVGGFTAGPAATIVGSITAGTIDAVNVGATLNVGGGQTAGAYTGTVTVNGNY